MDALAYEGHFLDHLAPVWARLSERGTFLVPPDLAGRARALGIEAQVQRIDLRRPPAPRASQRALVASYGDMKKARRIGYGAFAYLEHGAGQSYNGEHHSRRHPSYAGGYDHDDVEVFLVPNDHAAAAWRAAYPRARVAVVGSPRLAALPLREPGPGPVVAVSFHVNFSFSQELRPAFGHYKAALPALAAAYDVIGHAHPRWGDVLAREFRRLGIPFVADFAEVCRRADVYAVDNSSTLFEFAATGRPVVVLNAPWYRREVQHGLRFWEASTVGVNVEGPDDLLAGVALALADPPEVAAARAAALARVYQPREDAVEVIEAWTRTAVAA